MADAPKYIYMLTDKQVRVISDALSMQARFFNKHLKSSDIRYLTKVREALKIKRQKSSHGRLTFQEAENE